MVSQSAALTVQQATLWRGEGCIVYAPAVSLLSNTEEISFIMSEYIEQRKITQEKQRLVMMRRKSPQLIRKVKARGSIHKHIAKEKEDLIDEIE